MNPKLIPLVCMLSAAGCGGNKITEAEAGVERIRSTFALYQDVTKAQAAGYTVWSPDPQVAGSTCPSAAEGKMGYHLVNVPLRGPASTPQTGDALIDPMKPEMLLYEKRSDGTLHLVGVEWIVFKAAWEREKGVGAAPPTVFGEPLPYSEHTFAAGGPVLGHYELHAWVFKDNPLGMFAPYHPNVSC